MDADQDIQVKQTAEEKGEYDSVAESSQSKESKPNGGFASQSKESKPDGGFDDGFNPSRTKHEEAIDEKCSQDLIDLLRKNGVPEAAALGTVDFKAFFQFL